MRAIEDNMEGMNETKMGIINLIDKKKSCSMGEIVSEFSLSYSKGYSYVEELKSKGIIIQNINEPVKYSIKH